MICVGKNYYDHAREFAQSGVDQSGDKQDVPADPVIFTKSPSALADPGQKIVRRARSDRTGRLRGRVRCRHRQARQERQARRRAGVCVRLHHCERHDRARRAAEHKQWFLGKSLDGFCPVGPYLVTRDEFGVPAEQELATYVNDERRQSAKLKDMIFDVASFIETVTAYVPLEPGDLLATGTPAGVGIGFNPPRYLQPGDVVRIAISGIGELINPVV